METACPLWEPRSWVWAPTDQGQFASTAVVLFARGHEEALLAFFAFFFLFLFLVPGDTWSPLVALNPLSCFWTVAPLAGVVASAGSRLTTFLAFFFFFLASCSPRTGLWIAESWRMSLADTAASRHRCHSSASVLSSLLQGGDDRGSQGAGWALEHASCCPLSAQATEGAQAWK